MFDDLQKIRAWQAAFKEGFAIGFASGFVAGFKEGLKEGEAITYRDMIRKWQAKSMSVQEIAELLEIPVKEVRRLAKDAAK